jgi:putative DNA methylase
MADSTKDDNFSGKGGAGGSNSSAFIGARQHEISLRVHAAHPGGDATLLESHFPFREISLIASADRRSQDPIYNAHRWWARRPPSVMRGVILAAALPSETAIERYWEAFEKGEACLRGLRVHDMFAGGGSVLVEAARLGATPSGSDVDPLAVKIIQHELEKPDSKVLTASAREMLTFLERQAGALFAATRKDWQPLHYFYVHHVTCPSCNTTSPLYKNLVIARDVRKRGAVVRKHPLTVFCPDCFRVHPLRDDNRKVLRCCRQRSIFSGTFSGQRFHCPACAATSFHQDLKTAKAPRRLLAVEETNAKASRRIRAADARDVAQLESAAAYVRTNRGQLDLPSRPLNTQRVDARPVSFGIDTPIELFTDRQLAVFGHAFRWLRESTLPTSVVRGLTLAISNALTTNNRLCGYATDYGRLAPLFSVRSYSMPALSVELNPFHPTAGRGTLYKSLDRIERSTADEVRRYVWSKSRRRPVPVTTTFPKQFAKPELACTSATMVTQGKAHDIDVCVFDPPYFDFIAYSELSEFYRAWWNDHELGGVPLHPAPTEPVESFGTELGICLREAVRRLKPGKLLAFTFHSSAVAAWEAIGIALDKADLLVTSLSPVLSDPHMGHHTAEGNCEWDVVVVCRRADECQKIWSQLSVAGWKTHLRPLRISKADQKSMQFAIDMAKTRFGSVVKI